MNLGSISERQTSSPQGAASTTTECEQSPERCEVESVERGASVPRPSVFRMKFIATPISANWRINGSRPILVVLGRDRMCDAECGFAREEPSLTQRQRRLFGARR